MENKTDIHIDIENLGKHQENCLTPVGTKPALPLAGLATQRSRVRFLP